MKIEHNNIGKGKVVELPQEEQQEALQWQRFIGVRQCVHVGTLEVGMTVEDGGLAHSRRVCAGLESGLALETLSADARAFLLVVPLPSLATLWLDEE